MAMIPLGIDLDKERAKEEAKLKLRGPEPDTAGLAKFGIDYDSI
ncbi:MAG TPA: hypothetical protein VN372_14155 [Methanospirillum sp.]|nr:hypothetical protein [Methanospirillum sp.]